MLFIVGVRYTLEDDMTDHEIIERLAAELLQLRKDHKFVIERENKVMVQNIRYSKALRIIMFATTLPPTAFGGDDAGFFKRELQRCIGDAARALHEEDTNEDDTK